MRTSQRNFRQTKKTKLTRNLIKIRVPQSRLNDYPEKYNEKKDRQTKRKKRKRERDRQEKKRYRGERDYTFYT